MVGNALHLFDRPPLQRPNRQDHCLLHPDEKSPLASLAWSLPPALSVFSHTSCSKFRLRAHLKELSRLKACCSWVPVVCRQFEKMMTHRSMSKFWEQCSPFLRLPRPPCTALEMPAINSKLVQSKQDVCADRHPINVTNLCGESLCLAFQPACNLWRSHCIRCTWADWKRPVSSRE